jgi:hypothetical protein
LDVPPHGAQNFLFGHQTVRVFDEIAQDGEGLGPQRNELLLAPELFVGEVKPEGREV